MALMLYVANYRPTTTINDRSYEKKSQWITEIGFYWLQHPFRSSNWISKEMIHSLPYPHHQRPAGKSHEFTLNVSRCSCNFDAFELQALSGVSKSSKIEDNLTKAIQLLYENGSAGRAALFWAEHTKMRTAIILSVAFRVTASTHAECSQLTK